jgi:hypothetical protein
MIREAAMKDSKSAGMYGMSEFAIRLKRLKHSKETQSR